MRWTYRAETRVSDELRSLAESQNWRCAYCGDVMLDVCGYPLSATRDHVVSKQQARSRKGGYPMLEGWGNLVAACRACNEARGSKDAYRFYTRTQMELSNIASCKGGD